MFRRKRSADAGMTVHAEMPDSAYETDFVDVPSAGKPMSRRERRAAEKAAKREAMEAAKRQAARRKAAARHKAAAKKKGARNGAKKPQPKEQNKRAISAQATIPYREMGKDGICRVHDRLYSKTIRYLDLNYQLAQPDDKADIFDGWSEFLNYFDYTIHAQLTFSNRHSIAAELENLIKVRPRNDGFSDLMEEYANMLREQLQKGNNGLIRTKYITYSIEADNFREAKPKLERIEADILTNFKVLGVVAYPLTGAERLKQMYEFFNPDAKAPFEFSYDLVLKSGMSTKDYIAPTSFNFKNRRYYRMGNRYSAVSYLQILASELSDKMLAEFLDLDRDMVITMHIQSIEQSAAIKMVKGKVSDINKMKHLFRRGTAPAGRSAIPQRAPVPGDGAGAEHRADAGGAGECRGTGGRRCAPLQLCAATTRLHAGGWYGQQPAPGLEPGAYQAGADHYLHRHIRAFHDAGAVHPRRGIGVLRPERRVQQHDLCRPKAAQDAQRLDSRHTWFRQVLHGKAGDRPCVLLLGGRRDHLRPGG